VLKDANDLVTIWSQDNIRTPSSIASSPSWSAITNTPVTLSGYGITDAYTKVEADEKYVKTSGDTMTGMLKVPSVSANIIEFNRDYNSPVSVGQARFNQKENTFDFAVSGATGQMFEEFWVGAHNETGTTIYNGQAVYLTSGLTNDGELHVALASNDSINATATIAVATQDVLNGDRGKFTKYGRVRDFDTSLLTANQKVYLGTNGELTSTQPAYPLHSVEIGYCTISYATSGVIYVSIENNLAIEDLYNVTITTPSAGDSLIYENNKWINRNFGAITKESTGFAHPGLTTIDYNESARTITLGWSVLALYRSNIVPPLSAGWVSLPHSSGVSATQYLYYDGSDFIWSDGVPWAFDDLQIAAVVFGPNGEYIVTLRETHGTMQWQTHQEFHQTIGCYLGSGGDFSSYVLNSTISADRRPNISETVIRDEDLPTTLNALTTKTYTQFSLSGSSTMNFTSASTDIVALNVQVPFYNQFNGSAWVQTPFANNDYGAIFVFAMPAALDAKSQAKRFVFVQPQKVSTTLSTIQALTPNNVNLNGLTTLNPELVFIGKIIIKASTNNFELISVEKLTGTKVSQTSVAGNYLSTVSHNITLSGDGTASNPLGLTNSYSLSTHTHVHSSLSGLSSDDHTQYSLADGTRAFASSPAFTDVTASRATYFDANKKLKSSSTTATELGYVSGVTSSIQTQLGGKQPLDATLTSLSSVSKVSTGLLKLTNGVASLDATPYVSIPDDNTSNTSNAAGVGVGVHQSVTLGTLSKVDVNKPSLGVFQFTFTAYSGELVTWTEEAHSPLDGVWYSYIMAKGDSNYFVGGSKNNGLLVGYQGSGNYGLGASIVYGYGIVSAVVSIKIISLVNCTYSKVTNPTWTTGLANPYTLTQGVQGFGLGNANISSPLFTAGRSGSGSTYAPAYYLRDMVQTAGNRLYSIGLDGTTIAFSKKSDDAATDTRLLNLYSTGKVGLPNSVSQSTALNLGNYINLWGVSGGLATDGLLQLGETTGQSPAIKANGYGTIDIYGTGYFTKVIIGEQAGNNRGLLASKYQTGSDYAPMDYGSLSHTFNAGVNQNTLLTLNDDYTISMPYATTSATAFQLGASQKMWGDSTTLTMNGPINQFCGANKATYLQGYGGPSNAGWYVGKGSNTSNDVQLSLADDATIQIQTVGSNRMTIASGLIAFAENTRTITGYFNAGGDIQTDGTWRMFEAGGTFYIQKRVSGTWTTKASWT
jgi:hypothetical protein